MAHEKPGAWAHVARQHTCTRRDGRHERRPALEWIQMAISLPRLARIGAVGVTHRPELGMPRLQGHCHFGARSSGTTKINLLTSLFSERLVGHPLIKRGEALIQPFHIGRNANTQMVCEPLYAHENIAARRHQKLIKILFLRTYAYQL